MTEILFTIYSLISFIVCITGIIVTVPETEDETNIIVCSFYLQLLLYARMKDNINTAGIAIVLIALSVFLLPCNLLLLLYELIVILRGLTWTLFKWIFKKRRNRI